MPTNLAIDDKLIEDASLVGQHRTKKADLTLFNLKVYSSFKIFQAGQLHQNLFYVIFFFSHMEVDVHLMLKFLMQDFLIVLKVK